MAFFFRRMYFGEYPLSFAACINQVDCYRLLIKKKADPNLADTNGNTVMHLTVIHEKPVRLSRTPSFSFSVIALLSSYCIWPKYSYWFISLYSTLYCLLNYAVFSPSLRSSGCKHMPS